MKYSILGFNQEAIIQYDLDLTDLVILNYVIRANGNPTLSHTINNETSFVWIKHSQLSQDLPILRISEGTLKNRLSKLKKEEFLQSVLVSNKSGQGSMAYYSITEKTLLLIESPDEQTRSLKNDTVERPGHFRMTSNNISNKNISNIEDNNIISFRNNTTDEPSDYESHSYSKEEKKYGLFGNIEKKTRTKRKSLYDKCVDEIYAYTKNAELQSVLIQYLSVRLAIKEKPIYGVNQWKGLLTRLDKTRGNKIEIVHRSIEKGWCSFYDTKDDTYKDNSAALSDRVISEPTTTTEEERIEILEKQGKRSKF